MIDIRISEFTQERFSNQQILYNNDITQMTDELFKKGNKEDVPYPVLKFVRSEKVPHDKTQRLLRFELQNSNCTNWSDALNQCRTEILAGVKKSRFECTENKPLSFEGIEETNVNRFKSTFFEWIKSLEFRKKTFKSLLAKCGLANRPWILWIVLALILFLLLLLLLRGCVSKSAPTLPPQPPISSQEFDALDYGDRYDAIDDSDSAKSGITREIFVLRNDRFLVGKEILDVNFTKPFNGTVECKDDSSMSGSKSAQYTSNPNYLGEDSFTYTVKVKNSEGKIEEDTATVFLVVSKDGDLYPKKLAAVDDTLVCHENRSNKTFFIDVLKNDVYPKDSDVMLNIDSKPQHGEVGIISGKSISYTPETGFIGKDSFEYSIKFEGRTSTAKVYISVNPNDGSIYARNDFVEISKGETIRIKVLENDDYQGEKPTVTIANEQKPEHGSVAVKDDNVVVYTPDPSYSGNDSFKYSIAGTPYGTGIVSIKIIDDKSENVYGIANNDEFDVVAGKGSVLYPLDNDTPPTSDQKELKIYGVGKPEHGECFLSDDGKRVFYKSQPTSSGVNYTGRDEFTYYIAPEENGKWSEGVEKGYVIVNIQPNDNEFDLEPGEPDLPSLYSLSIKPGETGTLTLDNGAKPQVESKTLLGDVTVNDNEISYKSNGESGIDSFVFVDTANGVKGKVDVLITESDSHPKPDRFTTPRNQETVLNVLANDVPNDENSEIVAITQPQNGTAKIQEGGKTVLYKPNPEFLGWDSFRYRSSILPDQDVKVQIWVYDTAPVDDSDDLFAGSIAFDDAVKTAVNQPVNIYVLENDYPIEDSLQIKACTKPAHGTAEVKNDYILYTPDEDYAGRDSFEYTLDDDSQVSGTVSIIVGNEPGGNVAYSDDVSTYKNKSVVIPVLDNDQHVGGVPLRITENPKFGSAKIEGDRIRYTPQNNFVGEDSFKYYIGSDENDNSSARVRVHVWGSNPRKVIAEEIGVIGDGPTVIRDDVDVIDDDPVVIRDNVDVIDDGPTVIRDDVDVVDGGTTIIHDGDDIDWYGPQEIVRSSDGVSVVKDGTTTVVPGRKVIQRSNGRTVVVDPDGTEHIVRGGSVVRHSPRAVVESYSDGVHIIEGGEETIIRGGRIKRSDVNDDVTVIDPYNVTHVLPSTVEPGKVLEPIGDEKASHLILILDDTRDVSSAFPNLRRVVKEYLTKQPDKKAYVSCIVFDDSTVRRVIDDKEISENELNDELQAIKEKLEGNEKWDDEGKVRNYVKSLTDAAEISSSAPDDSKTYLISDGDSFTVYNQALSDNKDLLSDEVTNMNKKMINLSSSRSNK